VPTYQYSCTECGHAFEQFQSFTDDALTICPECDGRLRKVFNAVGVVFKGSGFYRNDSRTGSDKAPAAAGSNGSKGSGPGESGSGGSGEKSTSDTGSGDKGSDKGSGDKAAPAKSSASKDSTSAA
jgi:putative FmdB family regulatory protein